MDAGIDRALEGAVDDLIVEGGTRAITVRSLVARAGVTRDAFYRRFSGLGHFLIATALRRYRIDPASDTGSLDGDLYELQREQVDMFTDPTSQRLLPVLLHAVASDRDAAAAFADTFLAPRRESFVRMIDRAVERGDIAAVTDYDAVLGVVAGPMLLRALLPSVGPLDDDFARSSATAVAVILRSRTGDGSH